MNVKPALLSALAGLCLCSAAIAVPPIVDRCPKDAMAIVAIPNFDALQKDVEDMAKLIGQPLPMGGAKALMAMGFEKGVKTDGSAAVIIFAPAAKAEKPAAKDEMGGDDAAAEDEPRMLALVPVTDYAAFVSNFNAQPGEKGKVDEIVIQGSTAYAKDIGGGYAALSPIKELAESFTGAAGNKAAFEAIVGKAGSELSDKSDISIIVNMVAARPMMEQSFKERMEEMADRMAMMGGDEPNTEAADWARKSFMDDSKGAVLAMNIDNLGAAIEAVASFKEGSRWAKMSAITGKASELLGKLPANPYLVAMAIDLSAPELKSFMKEFASKSPKQEAASVGMPSFFENLDNNNGGSMVVGFSAAGLMGGALASTVMYTAAPDATAAVANAKAAMMSVQENKKGTVKWVDGEKEIAGVKVDSYEVRMSADPDDPTGGQAAAMIFGPGGPAGYVAKVDGGMFMTMSKNSKLMTAALGAAKGENSLAQEKVLSQVAGMMPKGRVMEGYLGVKGILDSVLPAAAMFGMPVPSVDIPENLPPAAMGLAPRGDSMQMTLYFPAPTIKTVAEIVKSTRDAMGGMEGEAGEARPEKKEDTGQPGF